MPHGCRRPPIRATVFAPSVLVAVLALAAAGCAQEENQASEGPPTTAATVTTTSSTSTPGSEALTTTTDDEDQRDISSIAVGLENYTITPATIELHPGRQRLEVLNHDRAPHNVTVLRTDLTADQLPTSGIRVDEGNPAIEILARSANLGDHESDVIELDLPAGRYFAVCTVPHHYVRNQMVATLVIR